MKKETVPKIDPPNYFMLMIIGNIFLHYFFPILQVINYPYRYFGIVMILLGVYLNLYVYFIYRKTNNPMETIKMPKVLILSGPFKFSRNPLYLGMLLVLLGEAILLGSLVTFIFAVLFLIGTNKYVIPIEERNLEKRFGRKYLHYKEKARRWL